MVCLTNSVMVLLRTFFSLVFLSVALGAAVAGEVFVLANGGQVVGELLNPDQTPREAYVVRTVSGAEVTLEASDVTQRRDLSSGEMEYERIKGDYPDTPEGQWKLAAWCDEHHLASQRKVHLERVIALDGDHREARAALGYSRIDGQWQTQEEVMERRGLRRYQGRWRTEQEIEVLERKAARAEKQRTWYNQVRRWSGWLGTNRDAEARQQFAAIDDPAAVKPLGDFLKRNRRLDAQNIYINALARIGDVDALMVLAERSIEDPVEEVRLTCLDRLEKNKHPDVLAYYVGKLKHKENVIVNRAGIALAHTGDESTIAPLVDALVTVHKFKISSGKAGQTSAGFNSSGQGNFTMGSSTKIVRVPMQNPGVLDALVALTGVNFSFDVQAWKHWHAVKTERDPLDARRD